VDPETERRLLAIYKMFPTAK